jgi:hypothetical protein
VVAALVVWWPAGLGMLVLVLLLAAGLRRPAGQIAPARMGEEEAWSDLAAVMEESINGRDDVSTSLARPYVLAARSSDVSRLPVLVRVRVRAGDAADAHAGGRRSQQSYGRRHRKHHGPGRPPVRPCLPGRRDLDVGAVAADHRNGRHAHPQTGGTVGGHDRLDRCRHCRTADTATSTCSRQACRPAASAAPNRGNDPISALTAAG